MEDIDALELDDEEWTQNLRSLVGNKNGVAGARGKRGRSPPTLSLRTELSEARRSFPGPAGRDQGFNGGSETAQKLNRVSEEASWKNAVSKLDSKNQGRETMNTSVAQIVSGAVKGKVPKMIVFVASLVANGSASVFARVKDESGEIGCAIHRSAFREFPNLSEKVTLLLNKRSKATVFSPVPEMTYLVLMPSNILEVFE